MSQITDMVATAQSAGWVPKPDDLVVISRGGADVVVSFSVEFKAKCPSVTVDAADAASRAAAEAARLAAAEAKAAAEAAAADAAAVESEA